MAQQELPFSKSLPHLFVHEGARQLLEKRLATFVGEQLSLSITDNRRTMISSSRRGPSLEVRLHHMFLDADLFTVRGLARYIKSGDRASSTLVSRYIEAHRQRIAPARKRAVTLKTQGDHHELGRIFEELNGKYFGGMVDCRVTWGRRTASDTRRSRQARSSIKLGTYCAEQKIIRIHPALDQRWVPRYFLAYVMYHEMLHHVVPMPLVDGRRIFHSSEFQEKERAFRHYERAMRWERRYVPRLLRA